MRSRIPIDAIGSLWAVVVVVRDRGVARKRAKIESRTVRSPASPAGGDPHRMSESRPSIGRRCLFALGLVLVILVALEAASFVMLWYVRGDAATYSDLAGDLQARIAPDQGEEEEEARRSFFYEPTVVHPYLGYVADRTGASAEHMVEDSLLKHGFYRRWGRIPRERAKGRINIAIFGGSVARDLGKSEALVDMFDTIKSVPGLGNERLYAVDTGLAAYKQPQQLMLLNYLLTLGARFDVVINLDGYNDVVFAVRSYQKGLYPYYPWKWEMRVGDLNPKLQPMVGHIAYLGDRRSASAAWLAESPLRFSMLANLIWRLGDRRLEHRLQELRVELESLAPKEERYFVKGPPLQYASEDEMYSEIAAYWARCSLQMHRLCEANGITYFHFLQPNQHHEGSKVLTPQELREAVSPSDVRNDIVWKGYPHLIEEGERLAAQGVRFHDLSMIFADVPETVYRDPCCHLNDHGSELLAQAMGQVIGQTLQAER